MVMNKQMPGEGMPQEGQPQGADVMKELGALIMQGVEQDGQAAEVIAQMGNKEAADMLNQAAQLKSQALQVLGIGGGAPAQKGGMATPNAVGKGVAPVGPAV